MRKTSTPPVGGSHYRLSHDTEKEFRMMVFNTLVQLRDCLMDLFEARVPEKGLVQAVYLLETLRRFLVDGNTRMDMHGLCVSKSVSDGRVDRTFRICFWGWC